MMSRHIVRCDTFAVHLWIFLILIDMACVKVNSAGVWRRGIVLIQFWIWKWERIFPRSSYKKSGKGIIREVSRRQDTFSLSPNQPSFVSSVLRSEECGVFSAGRKYRDSPTHLDASSTNAAAKFQGMSRLLVLEIERQPLEF